MAVWKNWKADRDRIFEMLQVIYDHEDMIWQEDWFELYDNQLVALMASMDEHSNELQDGGESWRSLREFIEPCRDCWFQEDYYDFCEAAIMFALVFAESMGGVVPAMLAERFPEFYQVS